MNRPRSTAPEATLVAPNRLTSLDAYRGFVMLLMMGEVLNFRAVAARISDGYWALLARHQSHAEWTGCNLHDLIQPSFSFLVGVALPFSLAARTARGQSPGRMTVHAVWRAAALVLLGVFLRSTSSAQTNWTFEDTLSQIGLGYAFLFLLGWQSVRVQWVALGILLIVYWAAFALWPVPAGFDYGRVGVSAGWLKEFGFTGFAVHWQKNSNLAWAFDSWFLNLFPRVKPWVCNGGGYATLSFIPTLGTMVLGLLAGGVLRGEKTGAAKLGWLLATGAGCLAAGWALGEAGVCPVVKKIWTPAWTLFSGGWCCLLMAAFYLILDLLKWRRWALPLVVVGVNSIAAYCIAHLWEGFIAKSLKIHLGGDAFGFAGAYDPLAVGAAVLLIEWLILFWMYRRKVLLRI